MVASHFFFFLYGIPSMDDTQQKTYETVPAQEPQTLQRDEPTEYIYRFIAGLVECVTIDDEDIPQYV
jgi:hypothetical protein